MRLSSPENSNDTVEEDSHDAALLHGTPSKKDFLDKVKQLRNEDEETDPATSIDHDLQAYSVTPTVVAAKRPEPVQESNTIVSRVLEHAVWIDG